MAGSIDDVARKAGVSKSTVSYVLNGGPRNVRDDLREKVLAAVRELDYRPSRIARAMVTGQSNVIGVIHAPIEYEVYTHNFVQNVLNGVALGAQRARLDLMLYTNALTDAAERALAEVHDGRVDGVIAIAPKTGDRLIDELALRKFPLAIVGGTSREGVPYFMSDPEPGMSAVLDHLLARGHTRFGYLYGDIRTDDGRERFEFYLNWVRAHGLPTDPHWTAGGIYGHPQAYAYARKLLSFSPRPTAILAANDEMAAGVIRQATEMGIRVPEELSVVGFDDTTISRLHTPPISTIVQPFAEIGIGAVEVVRALLDDRPVPMLTRYPTSMVLRQTTSDAPNE